MCAAYGSSGHPIQERTVLVGYACERHSNSQQETSSSSGGYSDSGYGTGSYDSNLQGNYTVPKKEKRKEDKSTCSNTTRKAKNGRQSILSSSNHRHNARVPAIPETIPSATIIKNDSSSATKSASPHDPATTAPLKSTNHATNTTTALGLGVAKELLSRKPNTAALLVSTKVSQVGPEKEDANYDSDSSKVPSQIWTESDLTADSNSTAPKVEIASAELVSLLVDHPRLSFLYAPAIAALGRVAIQEAMVVVLKAYAKGLKLNSSQTQEFKAGELVRSYSRRIAYACVTFHDPCPPVILLDDSNAPIKNTEGRREALHRQKVQASSRVEDYLNNLGNQTLPDQEQQSGLDDLSDDSDREDIGDPLPNLSKVKAFMTSGQPFEQLCKDVSNLSTQTQDQEGATFVELKKSKNVEKGAPGIPKTGHKPEAPELIMLCENLAPNSQGMDKRQQAFLFAVYTLYRIFISWLRSKFWPQLVPESTRLNWTCECGSMLYEDYATTNPHTIAKLSRLIEKPVNVTTSSNDGIGGLNIQHSGNPSPLSSNPVPNTSESKEMAGGSAHVCQILNGNCTLCNKRISRKFLALCVNTGRFHKTLGEIEVTDICRDSDAFGRIRSRYLEVRSFRARARRLFLLRTNKVHFVKINIEDAFRADIIEAPSIPPITEVHSKRYEYSPLDLPLPPITSNSFLHYLENPECESLKRTKRWLSCLPKRLEEQLLSKRISSEPDTIVSGWGIHIDETLNEEGLAILAFMILALSALVGVAYSVKMGDTSGGFTIAGYIATTLGVFVTVMYFRWQQE